jgi:hypothetical protein
MSSIEPKRYDAFLSYNSQDRRAVEDVAARLKREGLELYLAEWELTPGREFQPALAEGLHQSKTCVVFLGPNIDVLAVDEAVTRGSWRLQRLDRPVHLNASMPPRWRNGDTSLL